MPPPGLKVNRVCLWELIWIIIIKFYGVPNKNLMDRMIVYYYVYFSFLTPKVLKPFFSKKHLKSAISSSRSPNEEKNNFALLIVRICPRLLREHAEKVSQKLTAKIVRLTRLKWKEKFFFPCAWHGQQSLTAICAKNLNYTTLSFCTISMHIMLGTCVPSLRSRG
jgi:hypothetical protein